MEILSFPSLLERGPFLGSRASFLKKGSERGRENEKRRWRRSGKPSLY